MLRATILKGEEFTADVKFSPIESDDALKADFSALIVQFPVKRLAKAADCPPDTVKCWKAGRSFPQGRYLMRLVSEFPKIRAWHDHRTGGMSNPRSQSEMFADLERIMASNTAEGRAMRARFQQIVAEARNG